MVLDSLQRDSSSEPYSVYLGEAYLSSFIVGALNGLDDGTGPEADSDVGVVHAFVGQTINLSGARLPAPMLTHRPVTYGAPRRQATTLFADFLAEQQGPWDPVPDKGYEDYATSAALPPAPEPQDWVPSPCAGTAAISLEGRRAASERQRSAC